MKKKILMSFLAACLSLSGCYRKKEEKKQEPVQEDESTYACRVVNYYDYGAPVPASDTAAEDYYDDTLFAGDSRMGGIYLYGSHKNAEVYYVTSLNLLRIDVMPVDEHTDHTLMDYLDATKKKNIYLLFGINEIRNDNFDAFGEVYQEIIDMLKEHNPDVNIYIILSYHPRVISGLDDEALDDHLKKINRKMKTLAADNLLYYIDLDPAVVGDDGKIKEEYVFDGLHLNPDGVKVVEAYIGEHVAEEDRYVKKVCE